jgi:hypothetical protein
VITAAAAPLGIHVRDRLKPRGFDVAGSGSAKARALIAQASGTDPANSVLRSFASAPIRVDRHRDVPTVAAHLVFTLLAP